MDVDKLNICNVDFRRRRCAYCCVNVKVALVEHQRVISVLNVDILVRDIADVSVTRCRACPCLQTGAILAVEEGHVFDPGVGDEIFDAGVLADGSHADTMRAIAPEIFHEDVGCVWLWGKAVVTYVDASVRHCQTIDVE